LTFEIKCATIIIGKKHLFEKQVRNIEIALGENGFVQWRKTDVFCVYP
jgi:hypothetical protein